MIALKHAGASQNVLGAVIDSAEGKPVKVPEDFGPDSTTTLPPSAGSGAPTLIAPAPTPVNKPSSLAPIVLGELWPREPGVYYKGPEGWVALARSRLLGIHQKGRGASWATSGLSPVKAIEYFDGARAQLQISDPKPRLYFIRIVNLPTAPIIVQLDSKKDRREAVIGRVNAFSASYGYKLEAVRELEVSHPDDYVEVVTPKQALTPGEYILSLIYSPSDPTYEFSITTPPDSAAKESAPQSK